MTDDLIDTAGTITLGAEALKIAEHGSLCLLYPRGFVGTSN